MTIKLELKTWSYTDTENEYPECSLVYFKSLGEGAYGIVVFTPTGEFHLEEITQYGTAQRCYGKVQSLQEALEVMEEWE